MDSSWQTPGKKIWVALALLIGAGALLRSLHVRADPPVLLPAISGSAGIYFDEGIYSHNARNRILFGKWVTDEWNPLVYNLPLTGIYFLVFKLFGISIVTVKGVNILFGLLGILVFFLALRRLVSAGEAIIFTCAFAFDFYWLMYNRIGLLENFSALVFVLTFWLFTLSLKKPRWAFALGMCGVIAALCKYLFVYFLIALALTVIFHAWKQAKWSYLWQFLAGGALVAGVWYIVIYRSFSGMFSKIGGGWGTLSIPRSLTQAWQNLLQHPFPKYLSLAPVLAVLLVLFLALFFYRLSFGKIKSLETETLFIFLWIAGAVLEMGLLNYRPLRYYLPVIPALYLAGALFFREIGRADKLSFRIWPMLILSACLFYPFWISLARSPSFFHVFPLALRLFLLATCLSLLLLFIFPKTGNRRLYAVLFLAASITASAYLYYFHFYARPTFKLEAAASYMKNLPPQSVIMGQEAPRLTLETRLTAIMAYQGWFNDTDPFSRFKPTHLLVLDKFNHAELSWITRRFPEIVPRLHLLRKFSVWNSTVSLYAIQ